MRWIATGIGSASLQPLPNTPIYDAMVAQGLIQDVGSKELRFMGGAFGKQTEIEQGLRWAELGFREAFSAIPLDAVPSKEQVTDIWFYMNYHLNFHRLFTEKRPIKIRQQLQNLKILSEVISPENGFALYFLGVLEHQLNSACAALDHRTLAAAAGNFALLGRSICRFRSERRRSRDNRFQEQTYSAAHAGRRNRRNSRNVAVISVQPQMKLAAPSDADASSILIT